MNLVLNKSIEKQQFDKASFFLFFYFYFYLITKKNKIFFCL